MVLTPDWLRKLAVVIVSDPLHPNPCAGASVLTGVMTIVEAPVTPVHFTEPAKFAPFWLVSVAHEPVPESPAAPPIEIKG